MSNLAVNKLEMNDEYLQRVAPSIFALGAQSGRSKHYKFIPTIEIINALRQEGFYPVKAAQSNSKNAEKRKHSKHMVRFRKDIGQTYAVGDLIPEIELINSHDGTSQYLLNSGIYRLACSNGLVVSVNDIDSIKVRHSGNIVDNVIEGSYRIIQETPKVFDRIERMREVALNNAEKQIFARAAASLRWDKDIYEVDPNVMIKPIREADRQDDLWTSLNILQEKLLSGQTLIHNIETDKLRKARPVTNVDETSRLNKAIWQLVEEMLKLKQ